MIGLSSSSKTALQPVSSRLEPRQPPRGRGKPKRGARWHLPSAASCHKIQTHIRSHPKLKYIEYYLTVSSSFCLIAWYLSRPWQYTRWSSSHPLSDPDLDQSAGSSLWFSLPSALFKERTGKKSALREQQMRGHTKSPLWNLFCRSQEGGNGEEL